MLTKALPSAATATPSIAYVGLAAGGFGAAGVPVATLRTVGSSKAVPVAR